MQNSWRLDFNDEILVLKRHTLCLYQDKNMGTTTSKVSKPNATPEQKWRRDIEKYGVLIPPVFVLAHNENSPCGKAVALPIRLSPLLACDRQPISPSMVDYLGVSHVSHCIIHDYMTPGMWVLAGSSHGAANTTARASLPFLGSGGQISFAATSPSKSSWIEVSTGTEGPMHLCLTHQLWPQAFALFGDLNTYGTGYVGCQLPGRFLRSKQTIQDWNIHGWWSSVGWPIQ